MQQFLIFPERPRRWWAPTLASLLLHGAGIVALTVTLRFVPSAVIPTVDEIARFFLPPDQQRGMRSAGAEASWSGQADPVGVAEVLAAKRATAPDALAAGRPGETGPDGPAAATALEVEGGDRQGEDETALTEVEVDSAVVRDPSSAAPVYPAVLLERNIQGSAFVEYVVDTTGLVDTTTIRVLRFTHPEFAQATREALALMKFRPALHAGVRVRQWVQQNFAFSIVPPRTAPPARR